MYNIKSFLLMLVSLLLTQQVFAFSFGENFASSFGKGFDSSFKEREEDCPDDVRFEATFAWDGKTIDKQMEGLYNKYKKQVYSDTETLRFFKKKYTEAIDNDDLLKDWELSQPLNCDEEKGCFFECNMYKAICKDGQTLKDCNVNLYNCFVLHKIEQEYKDALVTKICKNTEKTEVQNTVTTPSSISTGDQSAYSGYDPAKASKQLHSTPEPIVNKQEPDEEEITIAQSANQSNIETGDNPAREICVEAKGRWDKDRDWCECPNGFQWNEDESEEKSIGCYQEDMPSNDKKEVNIDSNNQTSGTSSTRQDAKKRSSQKSASVAVTAKHSDKKEVCDSITDKNNCINKEYCGWKNMNRTCADIADASQSNFCYSKTTQESCPSPCIWTAQGICLTELDTDILSCASFPETPYFDESAKKCVKDKPQKNKMPSSKDKSNKDKSKAIIAGTPCKLENATTAMYKKGDDNQLVCKVVTCNPNYKKNATETACEAQQKETKKKCKELPANATAGIMEKNGSAKSCKVTACSSGYKVSDGGKSCVEQSAEEKAQEKTNLEKEYEADMEELHKAFLDKIEQLKQSNSQQS